MEDTRFTAWRWRFAGLVLGIAGALGLMLYLPELHPRLARIRGFIVPGVLLLALVLTLWPWLGVSSQLRRVPAHLVVLTYGRNRNGVEEELYTGLPGILQERVHLRLDVPRSV